VVGGEITTEAQINYQDVVRQTIKDIGYTDSSMGFDWRCCAVIVALDRQSPDIAMGVNRAEEKEQGAGDQGLMFGYACDHTPEFMPMPIVIAHNITMRLAEVRKSGVLDFLRPDGKSQVTVRYRDGRPVAVDTVVVSSQHTPEVDSKVLKDGIVEEVIKKVIPAELLIHGDCGLTGRKIIVDTYGGHGSHGGGAFSGKDPSKVDRSASYMARYVAKNIVAAGLAKECEVQLAYAIGVADPVSVMVDTNGTERVDIEKIEGLVREHFRLKPSEIIKELDLLRPIYRKTAVNGHFGRNEPEFTWERIDKAEELKKAAAL
jgi:S-adenosylmethionine synthetase